MSEKIRAIIEKTPVRYDGREIAITISLGVTEYLPGEEKADIIKRADDAMYEAKKKGRNRSEKG